jgi:hypothetical protein
MESSLTTHPLRSVDSNLEDQLDIWCRRFLHSQSPAVVGSSQGDTAGIKRPVDVEVKYNIIIIMRTKKYRAPEHLEDAIILSFH